MIEGDGVYQAEEVTFGYLEFPMRSRSLASDLLAKESVCLSEKHDEGLSRVEVDVSIQRGFRPCAEVVTDTT